jgi:starch phosphorylase
MVLEYASEFYEPAHRSYTAIRQDGFESVRARVAWNKNVTERWPGLRFREVGPPLDDPVLSGQPITLRAVVELAGLRPSDVRVEAVIGRIGTEGYLRETEVLTLPPGAEDGDSAVFSREFLPQQTGRLGFAVRVSPNHCDDPLTRPCRFPLKWG